MSGLVGLGTAAGAGSSFAAGVSSTGGVSFSGGGGLSLTWSRWRARTLTVEGELLGSGARLAALRGERVEQAAPVVAEPRVE